MQLFLVKENFPDPEIELRHAGYAVLIDRSRTQKSFARRFHHDFYPRFHVYIEDKQDRWAINLHLDQRAPVYAGVTAHSGEYDGTVVEQEMARIESFFKPATSIAAGNEAPQEFGWTLPSKFNIKK